ncbi:hypothetical protein KKF34_16200 [Myxococcota bacterium]|nr:hypothetical protein [Myxococcota bacterium]MBU1381395.1 hypothetical protein [Myxococcota bacterium]MBU1498419.1 hypothetical protein [Myxococcota bacterium]
MGFLDFLFGKAKDKVTDKAKDKASDPPPPPKPPKETPEEKAARKAAQEEEARRQTQAMMDQAMAEQKAKQAAAAAADPTLLAPFEGITVEGWAQAAAMMASTPDPAQQISKLAALGMDAAKYERVNAEFQARMQRDTAFVIATVFGNAFSASQGVNTDGPEPISFEKYGELAGAQAAWGEMGVDVNQKLMEVFGIKAVDVSNYGAYWSAKFMADYTLAMKHGDLMEKYKQKYLSGSDQDGDIQI